MYYVLYLMYSNNFYRQLINAQAKGPNQLHIISYLPLRALNEIIHNRRITLIDILMTKSLVNFGKLRSFLQVNEIVSA